MKRGFLRIGWLLCLLAHSSGPLWSQAANGSLTGIVVDESGGVVPGAEISLTSQASARSFTKISSAGGTFTFPALVPGLYSLRAELTGFKAYLGEDIKIDIGQEYTLRIELAVGSVAEEVTVVAGVELMERSSGELSNTITKQQIDNLPLDGRNPLGLIQLNAGTAANGRTNTSIAGNRTSFTSITLDGVNVQDNFIRANATDFSPVRVTVANVAEFTITTQNQGSEAGFGSNQVALVTPSGGNSFHGSAYLFHRNSAQAANSFFNNRRGLPKNQLIRNQFGATAAGPVIKDKLLFFANYEGQRIRQQSTANTTVLTESARQGLFTFTDTGTGVLHQVNILEAAGLSMDPAIQSVLSQVPANFNNFDAGDSRAGLLRNTAGFSFQQGSNNTRDQVKFRLDYHLSDAHSLEGTYQFLTDTSDRPDIDLTFNQVPVVKSGTGGAYSDFISSAWKWNVSPTLLNELRFGAFLSPVLFTTAEEFEPGYKLGGFLWTNPIEDFEGQGRNVSTWTLQDNVSWQRGSHSLRFGFQSNIIRVNSFSCFDCTPNYTVGLSTANPTGLDASHFGGGISGSDLATANALLGDLAGFLSAANQQFVVPDAQATAFSPGSNENFWEYDTYALYVGDKWRVNPKLTVDMGLRWEYTPNLKESNGRMVQINPKSGQTMAEALLDPDGVYDFVHGRLIREDFNNFAPSIGLAWDPFGDAKTVFRAGYGIAYVNDEGIRSVDGWLNRFGVLEDASLSNLTSTIAQGLPAIPAPEFELPLALSTIARRNASGKGTFGIPRDLGLPYVQAWNASIGRELFWDMAIEARYVGTKGTKLLRGVDLNQVEIFNNGFLDDFQRARQNGFLALAARGAFDGRYNPGIPGSQPLQIFPRLVAAGLLTHPVVRGLLQQGAVGQLGYTYQAFNLTGGFPFHPNPLANFADLAVNQASSTYHGGQLEVRRRFKDGLLFNANYTFSKVLTDASGTGQTNFDPFVDINNPGYDRQRAHFDLTHVFNANFLLELPFGRGRRFHIQNSILNHILGGWNMSSIFAWQSGQPFGIVSGRGTLNRAGRSGNNRADSNRSVSDIRSQLLGMTESGGDLFFINPSNVTGADGRAVAPDGAPPFAGQTFFNPAPGFLGGLPGNAFNGPGYFNWDFLVAKKFDVTEGIDLEVRGEFFNFINNVNFNPPDTWNINSTSFGQITSATGAPRIVQFALKVLW